MKKRISRIVGLVIALLLVVPILPVTSRAAGTLADYAEGTVFKIKEDGTYQDWILIDHNYLATGNQLLMRKNTIYYGTQMPQVYYYTANSSKEQYWILGTTYYNSALSNYLNNGYFALFDANFASYVRQISIPVVEGVEGFGESAVAINVPYKVFLLSHRELTGDLDTTQSLRSSGSFITYFSTASNRKSDNSYILRDGYGGARGTSSLTQSATVIDTSGAVKAMTNAAAPKYFRPCMVLPATMQVGTDNKLDGIIIPATPTVSVSSTWATSNTATLTATNATHYAVTTTNTAPSTGWQTSNSFTLTANGTYYAWARSATNTVSASRSFTVSRVDRTAPVVSSVTVPGSWAPSSTITINGTDTGSGIAAYAVTTGGTSPPVSGWQTGNTFTFSTNGSYKAWTKDNAGNVSVGYSFEITKVDTTAPVISEVDIPTDWVATAVIDIIASDVGSGIIGYALTTSSTAPVSGWQESNSFTLTTNGTYYAWARDGAGNTASQNFYFTKIDSAPPSISFVTVPTTWAATSSVTISAFDSSSGVAAYAVSDANTPPETGWQASNKVEITANGTYYAWARDAVGHVAAGYEFTVTKVDSIKPMVSSVTIPEDWGTSAKITLSATDDGGSGLSAYANRHELYADI